MKIAIEARALSAQGGGVRTYTYQLIRHLLTRASSHEYHIIYDAVRHQGTFERAQEHVVRLQHELFLLYWMWRKVPGLLQHVSPDLVHFTKAAIPLKKKFSTIVTIYDIIPILFPESQKMTRRVYWPTVLRHAASQSDHIITISEASKRDIVHQFSCDPAKITVTRLAVDHSYFRPVTEKKLIVGVPEKVPYILHVGTLEPRKNIPLLIRAFAKIAKEIPHQLIIAGKKEHDFQRIVEEVKATGIEPRVTILDFVSYQDLPALYSGADLFIWPSVYEGWGFPPQEAMACGTPVIVSDGGALPEVVGDAGEVIPFSQTNIQQRINDDDFSDRLGQAVVRILHDSGTQERMRQAGLERVQQFSWDKVAELTQNVYEKYA